MDNAKLEKKLNSRLRKRFGGSVKASVEDRIIRVTGNLLEWEDIIRACSMCVVKKDGFHVVNDITFEGATVPEMRIPTLEMMLWTGKARCADNRRRHFRGQHCTRTYPLEN